MEISRCLACRESAVHPKVRKLLTNQRKSSPGAWLLWAVLAYEGVLLTWNAAVKWQTLQV